MRQGKHPVVSYKITYMLADLDETLRQLLREELPIKNSEIDVKFDQPKREWSARLTKPTINLFLYDVRENNTLRNHQWQPQNGRPLSSKQIAARKRSPFRVDCTYMVTTWANEPEDEHRLLTRAMLALFRHPILREDQLVDSLKNQPFEVQSRFAPHDKLTNPAEVWGALDNELRPTVPLVITLALDPWEEVTGPIVRSFTIRTGHGEGLPYRPNMATIAADTTYIGGTISKKDGTPQANIDVAIKGTGLMTKTDDEGQFTLGGLQPGNWTLIAWPPKGRPKEKKISLPSDDGDFNLTI